MNYQQLNCPDCSTPIFFDTKKLLLGEKFSCSACGTSIGLDPKATETVKDSMQKFNDLKDAINKQKE